MFKNNKNHSLNQTDSCLLADFAPGGCRRVTCNQN